jgi:hypothetical protein
MLSPVEALPAGAWVVLTVVGERHGSENRVDVLQQPASIRFCEVSVRAGVEDHDAAGGVCRFARLARHDAARGARGVGGSAGPSARVKRSASSLAERACR